MLRGFALSLLVPESTTERSPTGLTVTTWAGGSSTTVCRSPGCVRPTSQRPTTVSYSVTRSTCKTHRLPPGSSESCGTARRIDALHRWQTSGTNPRRSRAAGSSRTDRATREGRPQAHRRPQPVRARLVQRVQDRGAHRQGHTYRRLLRAARATERKHGDALKKLTLRLADLHKITVFRTSPTSIGSSLPPSGASM